jgi:uncharacterized membrane protein HdeD (DUF308 family)
MSSTGAPEDAIAISGTLGPPRRIWWLWLVTGIIWLFAALVILQFDGASVKTVGVIVGCMFLFAAAEQLVVAAVADRLRWLAALFGVLFLIFGIVCLANPEDTFAGMADMLGFLLLFVGVWWAIEAFLERQASSLWWVALLGGIGMIVLAFWTSGQFFIHRAYTLLVFAGIWALIRGIVDIVRAFQIRGLG